MTKYEAKKSSPFDGFKSIVRQPVFPGVDGGVVQPIISLCHWYYGPGWGKAGEIQ